MGSVYSGLGNEEARELQAGTPFSTKEIHRLYRRFKQLDHEGSNALSTDSFLSIPGLALHPLVMRVVSVFDESGDDSVDFKRFVKVMAIFHPKAPQEDKMKFLFQIFDVKGDGVVDREELFQVFKIMVGNTLSEDQMHQLVTRVLKECDLQQNGKITFEEFKTVFADDETLW
eukprot:CAMPEP_0177686850 /NCGR_PEP_ID=MMETSP0447-20121125/33797_1 /TAXON_ID=0 /ORGANISM="Stygamoeba regulata, Strain BSH-02190019" /LENGTH=171 /DNA_ID=CAMNT_0019197017 /DNA_START=202 /DNA_END=714 /DNA_ORIENTATION=-